MNNWKKAHALKPDNGSLVIVKTRVQSCTCGGYQTREVYFDNGFHGIKNQDWVDFWMYSDANDILSQAEKVLRQPEPCKNCIVEN